LDGALRLKQLFQRAEEYKMPAIAMTDHGNMFGAVDFFLQAKEHGIKPIIGCEVYVAPKSRFEKTTISGLSDASYHLILLARNETGYKNLSKMITKAFFEGFYYKPRIDKELLSQHSEGLIALSSCLKGELSRLLSIGNIEEAINTASFYKETMGEGNYYLEIQDQGIKGQREITKEIIKIGKKLSIPLVATNDCHYLEQKDARAQEILLCIQTGKTLVDEKRMKFSGDQFYFKSPEEMKTLFKEIPQAISNTIKIAEHCNLEMHFDKIHLPHYDVPQDSTLDSFLGELARHGMEKRLQKKQLLLTVDAKSQKKDGDIMSIYKERLAEELKIIKKMNFSGYFLIVWDFIDYSKRNNIPVGPGRGSAAGSLVAYCLGITDIDPLKYGLLFERFLNPERISMPDIDIDFCMNKRSQVIDYVTKKYGKNNVSQLITFGSMSAKAVVRDVGRVFNMPYGDVDKIAKLIPNRLNIKLKEAIKEEPKLKELQTKNEQVKDMLDIALTLEGLPRHASTHAAGVVISPKPLTEFLPLYKGTNDEVVTQFAMGNIEKLGLLKMDFLGLKTLTVIDMTLKKINKIEGKEIVLDSIPLDDAETFKMLSEAKTLGVFQLESRGMRDLLRKMKPNSFEDVIALLALFRPGPLNSGMVDDYIKRKHGTIPEKYDLPQLKNILHETHGVILYQEQVMKLASVLAGFSLGGADLLRRAMGKKKPEVMMELRGKFISGSLQNKIPKEKAGKMFDLIEHFAGYGFNKSHSAAYAIIAYQTAYLKSHYPVEFLASLLTCDMDNTDKIILYINECREMGIQVLPPDVNESFKDFTVVENCIRFGLAAVKNVGQSAIEAILKAREKQKRFSSLHEFCQKVDQRTVNKRVIESLIKCGAFDSTGAKRWELMNDLADVMESAQRIQKDRELGQKGLFGFDEIYESNHKAENGKTNVNPWEENETLAYEKETLGFYITGHPLANQKRQLDRFTNCDSQTIAEMNNGRQINIGGIIIKVRTQMTKKGKIMAFITLEDLAGFAEIIVFPDVYKSSESILKTDNTILVKGHKDTSTETIKIIAKDIIPLSEAAENWTGKIHVNIQTAGLETDFLEKIKSILEAHRGKNDVLLHLISPDGKSISMNASSQLKVAPDDKLILEIEELLGKDSIFLN
ncbi:MAG TPA: DNA polymerase III subunit alpha, partial [Nitrospinota bacterium]|nr:DNA polymerase III subunit alpha [Nitrospinota bacterium]